MNRISATDLRPRLAEALRSAEGGEHVVITRHGRPAVALVAADELERLKPAADAGAPAGEAVAGTEAEPDAAPAATPEELLARAAEPTRN